MTFRPAVTHADSTVTATPSPTIGMDSPERFINRELSWLAFNERVLEEAWNPRVPLLERVRFLAISATNLNEFYMVPGRRPERPGGGGITARSQDGMTPAEQLAAIAVRSRALMDDQQRCWEALVAEMRGEGIFVLDESEIDDADRGALEEHFMSEIFPVLSPIASDPAHPFPFIPNLGFSLVVRFARDGEEPMFGLVPSSPGDPAVRAAPRRGGTVHPRRAGHPRLRGPALPRVSHRGRERVPGAAGQRRGDRGGGRDWCASSSACSASGAGERSSG